MIRRVFGLIKKIYMLLKGLRICLKTILEGTREKFSLEPDKKVLIMGNGPSLKDIDLDKLMVEVTDIVCVNYFPLKDENFFIIKPKYLCILDPVFFEKSTDSTDEKKIQLINLLEKVDWTLKIITLQNQELLLKNEACITGLRSRIREATFPYS